MDIEKSEFHSNDSNVNNHPKKRLGKRDTDMVCIKSLILLSTLFTAVIAIGFPFNMSVLYVELLNEFEESNSKTSLVQSVCTGVVYITGFPSGLLVSKFGTTKMGIAAGFLAPTGLILSYFATSIDYLIITIGLITGIGVSAAHIAAPTCIGNCFQGRTKDVALSVISVGCGIAGILQPILINALVQRYSLRGSLLLLGGLILNIIPFAGLWSNPNPGCDTVKNENKDEINLQSFDNKSIKTEQTENKIPTDLKWAETQTEAVDSNNDNKNGNSVEVVNKKVIDIIRQTFIARNQTTSHQNKTNGRCLVFFALRDLLGNKTYLLYLFAICTSCIPLNAMNIAMIDFLEFKGFKRNEAVELYMYMGISFTISTVMVAIGTNIPGVSVMMFPIFLAIVAAVALFTLPNVTSYLYHALLISCQGFGLGGLVFFQFQGTLTITGLKNFANGLGLIVTAMGISIVIAGPMAGGLFDTTGSYDLTFYVAGASVCVSVLLFTGVLILRKLSLRNQNRIIQS